MTHKYVKFRSFNATLFREVIAEKEKTAIIDQRAVAAGKNGFHGLQMCQFEFVQSPPAPWYNPSLGCIMQCPYHWIQD